jgi:hypothetical protein
MNQAIGQFVGMDAEYKNITSNASNYFTADHFADQIELIKKASEVAHNKIDYDTAHNEDTLYAVEIVEHFLRKTGRICYGGQAINAHLPAKHKIYNPEYSIPDYDVFTPSPEKDVMYIVKLLKRAGFTEISTREGMHEGTTKVYVDFIPVADITAINPNIFYVLYKRSKVFDGIHYLDANSLRMLMYLELSRPRGEVTRWGKVFERLMIFNEFVPIRTCKMYQKRTMLTEEHISIIVDYIIRNKRIFAGADLIDYYDSALKDKHINMNITTKKPILFYSPNSYKDAAELVIQLRALHPNTYRKFKIETFTVDKTDMIPYFNMIRYGKQIIACIIEYSACHAYITAPSHHHTIKIASLDTLITLYFSLGLLHKRLFNIGSMECMALKLVEISIKTREDYGESDMPFISVKCSGHQTSLPSLIRQKVNRITRKREQNKRKSMKR